MRYLKGTLEFGLVYGGQNSAGHTLVGYVDDDFVGDLDKKEVANKVIVYSRRMHS